MLKVKRFAKEYASYKIQTIEHNPVMQTCYKEQKKARIEKTLQMLERGLISIDESIMMIAEA